MSQTNHAWPTLHEETVKCPHFQTEDGHKTLREVQGHVILCHGCYKLSVSRRLRNIQCPAIITL